MEGRKLTDYEKVCAFHNLYKCHIKCRKSKRHKTEVVNFEMNLAENLIKLSSELESKTYEMSGYYHFVIREPKTRDIYAAYYKDRLVIRCLCDEVLNKELGPRVIYDNAACQKNKGTHFALDRMSYFLREFYKKYGVNGYALKCDIHKYFATINHQVLKEKLSKVIKDEDVLELLFHYINRYETIPGNRAGIPLGNQSSQWYGVYYLDCLDRIIKESFQVKYYIRYMDDFILIHHNKEFLKECMHFIENYVKEELKMELNNKTQIYQLKKGFEFLGWKFYLTDTGKVIRKIKKQSKIRVKRNFKTTAKKYRRGQADLKHVKQVVMSYRGHMQHGHTYQFRKDLFQQLYYEMYRQE